MLLHSSGPLCWGPRLCVCQLAERGLKWLHSRRTFNAFSCALVWLCGDVCIEWLGQKRGMLAMGIKGKETWIRRDRKGTEDTSGTLKGEKGKKEKTDRKKDMNIPKVQTKQQRKSASRTWPHSLPSTNLKGTFPILRIEKVFHRDVKWVAQGHRDIKWQTKARSVWSQCLYYIRMEGLNHKRCVRFEVSVELLHGGGWQVASRRSGRGEGLVPETWDEVEGSVEGSKSIR